MSWTALVGAIETGLIFGLVALGVYLSFRVLDFPDLTVDGSFALGGAVAATLIVGGWNPYAATALAILAGAIAGLVTAWLNVQLKILNLLASILTMISLYSINLRVMGRPNVALLRQSTLYTPLERWGDWLPERYIELFVLLAIAIAAKFATDWFLATEMGLAMRATGANPRMARAQGISTGAATLLGMGLSNGLVALGGALFAQTFGFADVTMGVGTIVFGLAAVIIGESLLPGGWVWLSTTGAVAGSIVYRIVVAFALNVDAIGLQAQDLNLVTAVLVTLALVLPNARNPLKLLRRKETVS
ncbi:ABC transporter permease [Synechococcus sp. PCC 7336]|uniref:ABC transporter permease n=1 Tax=Synechococcus sp. PCC 7336 TaxID=195250 RepID=UPI000344BC17|nr:ABC transporter permease [Synechococcus sp. PCC 7336]